MAKRDLASIGAFELLLHMSTDPRSEETKEGWTKQLEAEYEVDIRDARKAAEGSQAIKILGKAEVGHLPTANPCWAVNTIVSVPF